MSEALTPCIAVVEDEFLIAMGLSQQLEDLGHTVCGTAATAADAIALVRANRPAVVLMDVRLDGPQDGVDAAIVIHNEVGSKVIFITGSREPATMERIEADHPSAVLFKPVSDWQLRRAIEAALAG